MRTLVLYVVGHNLQAALISHDDEIDTSIEAERDSLLSRLVEFENNNVTFIEMPDENFRPTITDENGDEIPVYFD